MHGQISLSGLIRIRNPPKFVTVRRTLLSLACKWRVSFILISFRNAAVASPTQFSNHQRSNANKEIRTSSTGTYKYILKSNGDNKHKIKKTHTNISNNNNTINNNDNNDDNCNKRERERERRRERKREIVRCILIKQVITYIPRATRMNERDDDDDDDDDNDEW